MNIFHSTDYRLSCSTVFGTSTFEQHVSSVAGRFDKSTNLRSSQPEIGLVVENTPHQIAAMPGGGGCTERRTTGPRKNARRGNKTCRFISSTSSSDVACRLQLLLLPPTFAHNNHVIVHHRLTISARRRDITVAVSHRRVSWLN